MNLPLDHYTTNSDINIALCGTVVINTQEKEIAITKISP